MKQRLAVIGNGMAGVFCVEQILKHNHDFEITIFGDETHVNYNRILLSSVLAGEKEVDDIVLNDIDWYRQNDIQARLGLRIDKIDLARVQAPERTRNVKIPDARHLFVVLPHKPDADVPAWNLPIRGDREPNGADISTNQR